MVIKKTTKQQLHQENKPNTPLNNQKGHPSTKPKQKGEHLTYLM